MTTYRTPDYCAALSLNTNMQHFTGIEFSALMHRKNIKYPLNAMILICKKQNTTYWHQALVWIDAKNAHVTLKQEVQFELIAPCNPSIPMNEDDINAFNLPVKLTGQLTKNYASDLSMTLKVKEILASKPL